LHREKQLGQRKGVSLKASEEEKGDLECREGESSIGLKKQRSEEYPVHLLEKKGERGSKSVATPAEGGKKCLRAWKGDSGSGRRGDQLLLSRG